jgi:oxysterol-binding protein-related protein 9/10/11
VYPGKLNKGVFINLKHRGDEEYQLTHPSAHISGFISLKFHPYVTVSDGSYITCPKTKLKAILKYCEEVKFYPFELRSDGVELVLKA